MDLFIDTSGERVRFSLSKREELFEIYDESARGECLSDFWDQGLSQLKADARELKRILVVNGPGSFTGLRVGLAFSMGLAMPNDVPIFSVSTLGLWGFNTLGPNDVLLLPALPGYWFVGSKGFNINKSCFEVEERLSLAEIKEKFEEGSICSIQTENEFDGIKRLEYPNFQTRKKLFSLITPCPIHSIQANYLQASSAEKSLK